MSIPLVLLKPGTTFRCGKDGHITGKIVSTTLTGENDTHGSVDPESCGYIYTLNRDVVVFKRVYNARFNPCSNARYEKDPTITIRLLIPAKTLIRAGFQSRYGSEAESTMANKCRAAQAVVLPYSHYRASAPAYSGWDTGFKYIPNETVVPIDGDFDPDPDTQCSAGIHFFYQKKYADVWVA